MVQQREPPERVARVLGCGEEPEPLLPGGPHRAEPALRLGDGGAGRLPLGALRGGRRLPHDPASHLHRDPGGGGGGHRRRPDHRRGQLRGPLARTDRQRRLQDGPRHRGRRLDRRLRRGAARGGPAQPRQLRLLSQGGVRPGAGLHRHRHVPRGSAHPPGQGALRRAEARPPLRPSSRASPSRRTSRSRASRPPRSSPSPRGSWSASWPRFSAWVAGSSCCRR